MGYRVVHLVVHLGWVDLKFECSAVCLILPGLVGIWQERLGSWARQWNSQIPSQPNPGARPDEPPCIRIFRSKFETNLLRSSLINGGGDGLFLRLDCEAN